MPTKIELTLEQSQQGVSNEVLLILLGLSDIGQRFIEDVITKKIVYHLFDDEVEFLGCVFLSYLLALEITCSCFHDFIDKDLIDLVLPDVRRSYALSWKPCQGDSLNLPDHREKPEAEVRVSCYADASFQTDKDDTKSQTGYVFVLNGGAVDWKSAKQSTTAMFSTKVEYIAVAKASMEAVWKRKFIDRRGDVVSSNKRPMEMLCDNEPVIVIANNPRILKGARHFQRKYHYIRKVIQEREIVLKKVHTYDNVVDLFTKPMPYNDFLRVR
ncbi:hypothetical protein Tco_0510852 [Tanacetum coccineum]